MRGYGGNRKLIGKVVIPALLVLVMVTGAWGAAIVPIASPETTGSGPVPPNTRAGAFPSVLDGNEQARPDDEGGATDMDPQGELVSQGLVVNKALFGRTGMVPNLQAAAPNTVPKPADFGMGATTSTEPHWSNRHAEHRPPRPPTKAAPCGRGR